MEYATKASKPRTFVSANAGINEEEYLDWNKPLIHVEGQLDSGKLQQLTMGAMPAIYANILQLKIEEMKDTAANRDVNSGGTGSGITAAAAISALQEAGNKASRDMIAASLWFRVRAEFPQSRSRWSRNDSTLSRETSATRRASTLLPHFFAT